MINDQQVKHVKDENSWKAQAEFAGTSQSELGRREEQIAENQGKRQPRYHRSAKSGAKEMRRSARTKPLAPLLLRPPTGCAREGMKDGHVLEITRAQRP